MDLGVWHNFDICVYVILCNHIIYIYIYHKIITWYSLVWWSSRSGSWDGWPSRWGTNVLTFVFWLFSWMFEWHLGGRRDGCMRGCFFWLSFFPRKPKHKVVELLTVFDLIETWSCKIGGFTINGMMQWMRRMWNLIWLFHRKTDQLTWFDDEGLHESCRIQWWCGTNYQCEFNQGRVSGIKHSAWIPRGRQP